MKSDAGTVAEEYVTLDGETYFRIANSHLMEDFFMSLVGAGDHWMFISSNGALTAGRRDADSALFPYAADDQISAARGSTGSLTLLRFQEGGHLWEPFAAHAAGTDAFHRNLYKTPLGNKLVLEEVNESRQLAFRYRWTFSQRFGFVRSCRLENFGKEPSSLHLLDGLRNILSPGVGSEFFMRFSNLANAYKRSEKVSGSDLGLFYLSSIPTDRAEPSEGLRATTVWQTGLEPAAVLLAPAQVAAFRAGSPLETETDVRGKPGAYLSGQTLRLEPGQAMAWHTVAELNQDHAAVIGLDAWLQETADPAGEVASDIRASERQFLEILSSSDGIQSGSNRRLCSRHLSNTVFNVMRGGVPLEGYQVHRDDFTEFVANFNRDTLAQNKAFLADLPEVLTTTKLQAAIAGQDDPNLTRLGLEYLPLAFSRRHGDPTRPWNHFSIDLQSATGRTNLNYQGNWRDLFQNWEALQLSFPEFSTGMICRFVNATTADGYNPYKVNRNGFDWEEPSPEDPWANIGYWGDHQIIYLLKLLEWNRQFYPGALNRLLNTPVFTAANIPYRIKGFEDIRKDPHNTIDFDHKLSKEIAARVASVGADGKLLRNQTGDIHRVTLIEKFLTLSLAKLSNFVPDGGIWLNTQRPEWNDANNALVGNGLSMVTACYLHRWFKFLHDWISTEDTDAYPVSAEVASFFQQVLDVLRGAETSLGDEGSPGARQQLVEALSMAGSRYREALYASTPSGQVVAVPRSDCLTLFETARRHLESTIRRNRRPDGLYHAYNLLDWSDTGIEIEYLYEMLEGQVAALSSGLLTASEVVEVLDALRQSALYRENQDSYILYPNRRLPGFLEKNQIAPELVQANPLAQKLLDKGEGQILVRDVRGGIHFHGGFRNSADLRRALDRLQAVDPGDVREHGESLVRMFEELFGHRQFTGRSGTFFAYEGLGSIYWHMVSKLGLAVSENFFRALNGGAPAKTVEALRSRYRSVKRGIGAEKSPQEYGAFPTDPYSHTPENAGVKQPGMTGQVKEDILARFAEIGVHFQDGCLCFRLDLFDRAELLVDPGELTFFDQDGESRSVDVPAGGFGFTLFQIPIIYQPGESDTIEIRFRDGTFARFEGRRTDAGTSRQLFSRSGNIDIVLCKFQTLRR